VNKIHSAIGIIGVFGVLAVASGTAVAAHNPAGVMLFIPGTTSVNDEAFDTTGDVVSFVAALDPGGMHITNSSTGFKMNPGHNYSSTLGSFSCSLTGLQPGTPYETALGNQVASGNQAHACELFFLGDAAVQSNLFVLIN
jgi:hypothetical protein